MIYDTKPRTVPLITREWDKGYVDKFLVLNKDNEVKNIMPYSLKRATPTQYGHVGDTLIRVRHFLTHDEIHEDHFTLDSQTSMVSRSKHSRKNLPVPIKACITLMRDPAFKVIPILPTVYNMNPKFDCSIPRKSRFIKALDRVDPEMYAFIVGQLQYSRNEDTPSDWRSGKVQPLPQFMNVRERLVVDNEKDDNTISHSSQHWLLWMEDGTIQWDGAPTATSGAKVDASTGKTLKVYNDAPKPLPKNVKRALKITLGLHSVEKEMLGVGWSMYSKP